MTTSLPSSRAPGLDFGDSRTGRRNRRLLGTGGAVALHLALLYAFLGSSPGGVLAAGGGAATAETVEPYIVLSLSGLHRADAPSAAPNPSTDEARRVQAMLARMRDVQPQVVIASDPSAPRASLSALLDAVQRERAARDAASSAKSNRDNGGQGADDQAPDVKPRDKAGRRASAQNANQASPGSSALWGFLEPCWRKLPGRSAVPVTLEVSLNSQGTISIPPKIVRPANASLNEARLVAEARALAALSACLPYYGKDAAAGAPINVEFAASR